MIKFDLPFVKFKFVFFHFYFVDILNMQVTEMKSSTGVRNIHVEGTASQIFYIWLNFSFSFKNG